MGWVIPVIAAGLAISAVGAGLSVAANSAAQSSIDAARRKSAVAQQEYQRKASAVFDQNLPNNSAAAAQADIAKGQGERQNAFAALRNLTQTQSAPSANSNTPEALAANRTATAGNVFTNNANATQSKIGGYGDWSAALNAANSDANSRIGVINNAAHANAALLPGEIDAASHKGDALGSWGKILSAIGTTVGSAGGGGSRWGSGGVTDTFVGDAAGGGPLYGSFEPGEV